jgi:GAF domain-containing protein
VIDATVLVRELQSDDSETAQALCALAADLLQADDVGFTSFDRGRYRTLGATSRRPAEVDAIQFRLDDGPSLSAMSTLTAIRVGDLDADHRWSTFGRRAVEATGLRSMMALPALASGRPVGALAAYAARTDAFDESHEAIGSVLGAHAARAVASKPAEARRRHLAAVLGRNRRIGTAMGILMADRRWSENEAYEALALEATRRYARDRTSRILDIADEVIRGRMPRTPSI